jgi:hypothetical protein
VASKRSASFFKGQKPKLALLCPFRRLSYARRLMPVNRALKAAQVSCALFVALEALLEIRGEAPPSAASSAPHLRRLCRVLCLPPALRLLLLLRFYCGLHELSNKQQEVDTTAAENQITPPPPLKEEGGGSPRSACSAFCLLRRRPAQSGCCAAGRENLVAGEELRGRESRAKLELRLRTSPRSLALLSAFCAAGQPKVGAARNSFAGALSLSRYGEKR